jgi:hypothetical protein
MTTDLGLPAQVPPAGRRGVLQLACAMSKKSRRDIAHDGVTTMFLQGTNADPRT